MTGRAAGSDFRPLILCIHNRMEQFPQGRYQTIQNYQWRSGAWHRRASQTRAMTLVDCERCQRFLEVWLNKTVSVRSL